MRHHGLCLEACLRESFIKSDGDDHGLITTTRSAKDYSGSDFLLVQRVVSISTCCGWQKTDVNNLLTAFFQTLDMLWMVGDYIGVHVYFASRRFAN